MKVLGVNAVYHETSAALVVDGEVVAAVEEERFNRRKHGAEARVDNADELPLESIRYCLGAAGVTAAELDAVCYSFDPAARRRRNQLDPYAVPGSWGSLDGEAAFLAGLGRVERALSDALGEPVGDRLRWVPHHLAHAASSYYASPFDEAAILVADGIGEYDSTLLAYGSGGRITPVRTFSFPDSLGFLWERLSAFLGFSEYDACKVMGLAGYGDPRRYEDLMAKIVRVEPGAFAVDDNITQFRQPVSEELARLFGPLPSRIGRVHEDVAAALQHATNEIVLSLARSLYDARPTRGLCLAGGVALNCTANWVLKENGPHEEVYVPSAPHDAGTAVGAALHEYHRVRPRDAVRVRAGASPYTGPEFGDAEVLAAVERHGLTAARLDDAPAEAARRIAAGEVVGWFQGRMEFGPRALGNRSLLADPRDPYMRDKLNVKVKHREPFRPFAPSVLAERAAEWLELGRPSDSYEYMLYACPVREEVADRIPAVLHVDGTARVQLVTAGSNARYHALISAFHALTGVPVVLNTSFNDSEPIVCTPDDAIATFLKTDIDALFLGDHLVTKR
ncbi:MAG TPA: carbamoyltransferase C-terminal domain-containing protein [Mycobacteriales bacterium]|jgi:carbamoyltransferase|nr:carbamoyltransferase C-terminal domain-containing protein [Mycobacteriales bacterium]